ncbi:uncharacterized protein LOC106643923, partial [Copidosoma floridanum]|uniref:uncharacterized protein LOC106643923 n=1 Tax=Copidosoma floridanum TaxID=29053 RepID=UPI000C6F48C0
MGSVEIVIQSRINKFQKTLNCLIIPNITSAIPNEPFPREAIDIPNGIRLADPQFHVPRSVDILIGSGWVIVGGIKSHPEGVATCNLVELNEQLAKFWELEEVSNQSVFTTEESACENHYVQNTRRDDSGRYIVRLPFKSPSPELGDSRSKAFRLLQAMRHRFKGNPNLEVEYTKVMQEYVDSNHMTLIEDKGAGGYCMPHHAVVKPSSTTTKTRVVFNASSKTDKNLSLNDMLMVGPTIQPKLFNHLLRFRTHTYVVTADIEKMYRQILVDPRDRPYQRILWVHQGRIRTYELNTVTFGVSSAPFLAIRTIHQLAEDERANFPRASVILKRDFYVDDLLTGANSLQEVLQIRDELIQLLASGGFPIRKWASNHAHALDDSEGRVFKMDSLTEGDPIVKTLGISWDSQLDCFAYVVKRIETPQTVTKRVILSEIAKIFDPLGLLGPVVFAAKVIMQDCWKAKVGWDESVPQELHTRWRLFVEQLDRLEEVSFPRHLILPSALAIEVHGFCDASKRGYGACIYLRSVDRTNQVLVRLACAKSRVAPVKQTTIPRLELCGALTLVRLFREFRESFEVSFHKVVFWSDSEIVLQWIKKPPQALKVFEGNRVAEIQELSSIVEWRHVSSKNNFADVLSRGQVPAEFIQNDTWSSGMKWLYQSEEDWPKSARDPNVELPGLRTPTCLALTANEVLPSKFEREIRQIEKTGSTKNTKIATFNPFIDPNGLLRVGGRLRNAQISDEQKYPILLPSYHHVTDLIIRQTHQSLLHAGIQSTLYRIRQKFWLLDGKNQVRRIVRHCVTCVKHRPVAFQGKMSDLPQARVQQASVFEHVGIDYFGPINIKEKQFRNRVILQAYGCVFICMNTKAVHIEIASDQTTEGFL